MGFFQVKDWFPPGLEWNSFRFRMEFHRFRMGSLQVKDWFPPGLEWNSFRVRLDFL